ncbi:MAG: hypothetical protein ABH986_01915 [archaeon]
MEKTLYGVAVDLKLLPNVLSFLREKVKPGMNIGVEYTAEHYAALFNRNNIPPQDNFWRQIIDFLKEKKCNVVFLDSPELRNEINVAHHKRALTLADAKKVFAREEVFLQKIPGCKISVLGAAHAIRLSRKTGIL